MAPSKRQIKVIGKQWVTDPNSKHPCPRCRELNGHEYYDNPKPGQRSTDELPPRPLHPNCRCKLEPIYDYGWEMAPYTGQTPDDPFAGDRGPRPEEVGFLKEKIKPVFSEDDKRGGITLIGVVLGNDGRDISDGPAYGYYGGKGWMKGRDVSASTLHEIDVAYAPPFDQLDVMDKSFKQHDDDYVAAERTCNRDPGDYGDTYRCFQALKIEADRKLAAELKRIRDKKLLEKDLEKRGRSPKQKEYAERFLRYAFWYFDGVVANADSKKEVTH